MATSDPRLSAVRALNRVLPGKGDGESLREVLRDFPLQGADGGLMRDICFGVCRHLRPLNHWLNQQLGKPLKPSAQPVRLALLAGLYELWFSERPAHAIVNAYPQLCRKLKAPWAAGLSNAILRKASQLTLDQAVADANRASKRISTGSLFDPEAPAARSPFKPAKANAAWNPFSNLTDVQVVQELSKNKKATYEEPVTTMLDALVRIHLLLLSFVRASFLKPWVNALGKSESWFTLDDMHLHYSYLWQKATEKKITSVEDFMKRELELRVIALGHQMGPEKLSLAKALNKARQECGDLWMNFQTPLTEGTSPLAANPMKRDLDDQQSGANKKLKTTGVQRASNSQETYGNGEAAPLKNGNRAGPGRVTLPDGSPATLCSRFRDGRGCSQWPCGGIHACDILIKKENYRPCLGKHSRANCPHNK